MAESLATGELADWALAKKRPSEARRASRIECDLWVRVGGVDATARARSGNISVTGLYVSLEEAVGSPGDVVWLSLSSIDKARSAQTMARVTRVVRQDDLHRGAAVVGAGFEFLPIEQPQPEIVGVVRHVTSVALGLCGGVMLDHDHSVRVTRASTASVAARLLSLGRDRVVLSTPVAIPFGEPLRIEVTEPSGARIHVHGTTGPTEPDYADERGGRFAVVVRFTAPDGPIDGEAYADRAVESLRDALIAPRRIALPEPRRRDLSGQISRVHLSSILSLLEMEHLEGIVTIANEQTSGRIFLAAGRVVDAELDHSTLAARDVLTELLDWTEGEFSIVCVPVRRQDRFDMPTTALLLAVARERDERVA